MTLGGAEADDAAPPAFAVVAVVASGGGVDALATLLQRHTGRDAQHELEESLADLYLSQARALVGAMATVDPPPPAG